MPEREKRSITIINNTHIFLLVLTMVGGFIFQYATAEARADETARRVHELEQRRLVDQYTFENYQRSVEMQLTRIETEVKKPK